MKRKYGNVFGTNLVGVLEVIRANVKEYRFVDTVAAFKSKKIQKSFRELDVLISKRFGVTYTHNPALSQMYSISTVDAGMNSVLSPYREKMLSSIRENLKMGSSARAKKVYPNVTGVMNDIVWSAREIKRALRNNGLVVNHGTAKISGLPVGVISHVWVDIVYLVMTIKMSSRELAAVLLHEIGHSFYHIAYMYRKMRETSSLLDSMASYADGSATPSVIMRIVAKEHLGRELTKSKDETIVVIDFSRAYIEKSSVRDTHSSVDSEYLADQFSVRFGFGDDLAKALDLLYSKQAMIFKRLGLYKNLQTMGMLVVFLLLKGWPLMIHTLLYMVVNTTVRYLVGGVVGDESRDRVYDIPYTRFKRIKIGLIRQLRLGNADTTHLQWLDILEQITIVEKIISKYKTTRPTNALLGNLLPWNINAYVQARTQNTIEWLENNPLYKYKKVIDVRNKK